MDCTLGIYEKAMPNHLTWEEKLHNAKDAGFDALELSIDESDQRLARLSWTRQERKTLLNLSRDIGLYLNTMCLSGHRKFPLGSGIPETEQRGMSLMESAIELAYDLGIRIIQLAGYDIYYEETSTPATRERFFQNLRKSVEMAAGRGVILALETMENEFLNTIEKAMYYVSEINSPYLKVYPDMGNVTNATLHVAKDIRSGKGQIAAAHLKETRPGVFRDLKYGEGHVDFQMVTQVLKEQGVRMYTAEFWYNGSENWQDDLKTAHDYLRRFL